MGGGLKEIRHVAQEKLWNVLESGGILLNDLQEGGPGEGVEVDETLDELWVLDDGVEEEAFPHESQVAPPLLHQTRRHFILSKVGDSSHHHFAKDFSLLQERSQEENEEEREKENEWRKGRRKRKGGKGGKRKE